MIIDTFLESFGLPSERRKLEADIAWLRKEHSKLRAVHLEVLEDRLGLIREAFKARAAHCDARQRVLVLRDKLIDVRPYVLAFAYGPSLQAQGDLRALDAVLRSTKP